MPPARLDTREARPLTSREIAKIITSILGGVATVDPDAVHTFPAALQMLRWVRDLTKKDPQRASDEVADRLRESGLCNEQCRATWFAALSATVAGLSGWCGESAIDTAITWTSENLHRMAISMPPSMPC